MKRTAFPPRQAGLSRTGFRRNAEAAAGGPVVVPLPRSPISPVSKKRARENRERSAMADRRWPDRRDGTVMCAVSSCGLPADDLHEILPRGRGGSITDEENTAPACRRHNEELTESPAWGYREGLLKHDGLCCQGRRVCSRYARDGAA